LEEQSEKLKEMDKVKSRFFVNISHDFRTPLTLIMGLLEQILSNTPNRKELEKKAKMMLRNSQRLLRLINQLLELSKFESGKIKMEASGHNLVSFIKGIAASFEALANQNDMALRFQAEEEAIPLYIDTAKMEEVICNLLINALKFTPAGGEITVTVSKGSSEESNFPTGYVEISVCDTGPGIPREQLANIFDRFYQSDNTYEYQRIGSGIGLEIAKELVELHHGTIAVQSREGDNSGTEFIIRLPMGNAHLKTDEIVDPGVVADVKPGVPADVKAGTPDTDSSEAAGSEKVNDIEPGAHEKDIILVVEDSADVREYIRGALELLYVVVDAKDGKQGIQKAKEIVPDLIISDIMMPEKDGYELCRVLKNDIKTSHIPIILLTVKASEENIIEGLETGADDYITKPFNMKILFARIKNLIDLRTHLQQTINREMTLQPAKMSVSKVDEEFLNDLQTVINKNISDPEFNVEELCKALYIGRTTLYRKIQALSGATPTEFIRSYRLKRGAELLKNKKSCTVLEVALDVGFSDATYFTKCFKKKFHQLPSEFREISKLYKKKSY
jgi:DNA-binding response OmpR family regulator/two-component sensor histidine kinase